MFLLEIISNSAPSINFTEGMSLPLHTHNIKLVMPVLQIEGLVLKLTVAERDTAAAAQAALGPPKSRHWLQLAAAAQPHPPKL